MNIINIIVSAPINKAHAAYYPQLNKKRIIKKEGSFLWEPSKFK